ncbi:MAG: hypothetical protein WAU86_14655 [Oricola sp.]
MSIHTDELSYLSDKELLERLKGVRAGSSNSHAIKVELERRALISQLSASKAQKRAAEAAMEAAVWTRRSAVIMTISVVALVIVTTIGLFR